MRSKDVFLLSFLVLAAVVGCVWFIDRNPRVITYVASSLYQVSENIAAAFFKESITITELSKKYKRAESTKNKVNVLIVPGHEPGYGGAEFGGNKERDVVVDISNQLAEFIRNNDHYNVIVTRDKDNWNTIFSNYFILNQGKIVDFVESQKRQMRALLDVGKVAAVSGAYHSKAPEDVALRLYGINKWANDNDIDIEIHVHLNDYPRKQRKQAGEYSGLTIYVPESQYSNSTTTRSIAKAILTRLVRYNPISNLPEENSGVVEDQDLIAVGSNNNAEAASLLIEYGYIYEPRFQNENIRELVIKDLAYQTYLGLEDFFGSSNASIAYDTLMLPYKWQNNFSKTEKRNANVDVLALQSALVIDGHFPSYSRSKNDCPRSGIFGECTPDALKAFQNKYNITGEENIVGPKTREVLNSLFGL